MLRFRPSTLGCNLSGGSLGLAIELTLQPSAHTFNPDSALRFRPLPDLDSGSVASLWICVCRHVMDVGHTFSGFSGNSFGIAWKFFLGLFFLSYFFLDLKFSKIGQRFRPKDSSEIQLCYQDSCRSNYKRTPHNASMPQCLFTPQCVHSSFNKRNTNVITM